MKKFAAIYRDSYRELKNMRAVTVAGMLMAVSVVLGYFSIEAGPYLKIGFGTVVNQFVYYLFGPVLGGVYGGVLDLVKYVAKPTGAFFPGYTFNAILAGIIYGTFLYRRPMSFRRVLAVHLVIVVVINMGLNTLWLCMTSGKAFMALLPARVFKNLVKWPVDSAIVYLIASRLEALGLVRAIRSWEGGRERQRAGVRESGR